MFENEVFVETQDKELLLYHIRKVNDILDKYPYQSKHGYTVTSISRAKNFSQDAEEWIDLLSTKE